VIKKIIAIKKINAHT